MRNLLQDGRHLVRAAMLFAAVILAFLVVRSALVPEGFGKLGHYRAGALDDARAKPLLFAGRAACEECHTDVVGARNGSKHARVSCEACHGAQADHAADPTRGKPARPDASAICLVCHQANVAKPEAFPQVDPKDHSGGEACSTCHKPHHPEIS